MAVMNDHPIHLVVNGEKLEADAKLTIAGLLSSLKIPVRTGIAVAVNAGVVPRSAWEERILADGEQVLILTASQGG